MIHPIANTQRSLYCWAGTKAHWGPTKGRAVCCVALPDLCSFSPLVWDTIEAERNFSAITMCFFSTGELGWRPFISNFNAFLSLCIDIFPNVQISRSCYFLLILKSGGGPIKKSVSCSVSHMVLYGCVCTVFRAGEYFWSRNACKYI